MSVPRVIKNIIRAVILTLKDGTPVDTANPLPVTVSGAITTTGLGETTASDGTLLELDAYTQTFNFNGDGTLNYIQVTHPTNTFSYRQSYTYTLGIVATISGWVKQ